VIVENSQMSEYIRKKMDEQMRIFGVDDEPKICYLILLS
jgi:hypothetical protein